MMRKQKKNSMVKMTQNVMALSYSRIRKAVKAVVGPHLGAEQVGEVAVVLTLVALQDELVDALNHFPGGSVTKTENVLMHTLTEGTRPWPY